jgi:NAD(P)-dependent dehydrogenase (short-subunit alcohol dehydrogenase family)
VAGSIEDSTEDQFHRAFEVNVLGPFLGTRAVTPVMRQAGGGSIIIMSSAGGLEGNPGMALYGRARRRTPTSPRARPSNWPQTTSASTRWHRDWSTPI